MLLMLKSRKPWAGVSLKAEVVIAILKETTDRFSCIFMVDCGTHYIGSSIDVKAECLLYILLPRWEELVCVNSLFTECHSSPYSCEP